MPEETITLFNPAGAGKIEYRKGVFFKPGTSIAFPIKEGLRLKKIYKDRLRTLDDFKAEYVPENADQAPEIKINKVFPDAQVEEKKAPGRRGRPPKDINSFEKDIESDSKQMDIEELS